MQLKQKMRPQLQVNVESACVPCGGVGFRLSAKAKEQGSRFYQASITTAASTAEGIKRLALGEPLQVTCCCNPLANLLLKKR